MKPSSTAASCALAAAWLALASACGSSTPVADTCAPPAPLADADTAPVAVKPTRTIEFASTPVAARTPGNIIVGVAVADFDGDGKPDLAAAASESCLVVVVLGKDGFSSTQARTYPACQVLPEKWTGQTLLAGIVSADFDGDGRPDIAVTNRDGVALLLGNGDGSFQAPRTLQAGDNFGTIVTGDFDGGGGPDLAVANRKTGDVNVLLGTGRGAFQPARPFLALAGSTNPLTRLLAADLDGDGKLDLLAMRNDDPAYAALLGRGDGSFVSSQIVPIHARSGQHVNAAAMGDFDGDGKLDLAVALQSWGEEAESGIAVLPGRGDGTFRSGSYLRLEQGLWLAITPGDFDGDGKLDLAVGELDDMVLSLHGNGDGTFRLGGYSSIPGDAHALVAADLDGDGKLDLALGDNTGSLSVLAGKGDGSFRGARAFPVLRHPERIVTGDLNGDGVPDVVIASDDGVPRVTSASDGSVARITVLLGEGRGGLVLASQRPLGGLDAKPGIALADVDGDGKLDLVCARGAKVLRGRGDGTFGEPRLMSAVHATDLVLGDFHGRGELDLVQTLKDSGHVWLSSGQGDGTFVLDHEIDLDGWLADAAAADLDGDGKLDLVVSTHRGLRVLYGRGDGTFDPPQRLSDGEPFAALAVADLDGDGRSDLVAARKNRDESVVLMNAGHRALLPGAPIPMSGKLALRDLDGDGVPDLAVLMDRFVAVLEDGIKFLHGNGDGTFGPPIGLPARGDAFALADLDRDGRPDLLVIWPYEPVLRLFDNHSH